MTSVPSSDFPPAVNGVVPASPGLPPAEKGVVPACSDFPPAVNGVVPGESVQAGPSSTSEYLPGVEHGSVGMSSLAVSLGLQTPDLGVFIDIRLMDGCDDTPSTSFFPSPLDTAEAQVLDAVDCHVPLVYETDNVRPTVASVIASGSRPFSVGKAVKRIDIDTFHFSSGYLNERLLRETAKQQGLILTGVLQPRGGCLEAKGERAGVPQRTTSRARWPMETVHIDLAGPYEPSMGRSVCLIMFVDSESRWMRPYGMASKAETTKYVQRFLADMNDMGTPRWFRTDNGGEFISRMYTDVCDSARIRREYAGPGKLQQKAVVESAIWRAMTRGHATRCELRRQFPDVDFAKIPNVDAEGNRLCLEAVLWAADGFNRSAAKANPGWRSPYEVFFSRTLELQVVPYLYPV